MEKENITKALLTFKARLEESLGKGIEVKLFGSVARGDDDKLSDREG